jgi:hypothetical protein
VRKCTEKEIYTPYGRLARGGGVQNPNLFFENDAECVKTFGKNSKKKRVRNIHAKNSEML